MKATDKIVYTGQQIENILRLLENIEVKGMQNIKNLLGVQMILSEGNVEGVEKEGENGSN